MYAPGSHIPVVSRESVNLNDYDYVYLGAWNFRDVIVDIESEFVENGGKFITHVPNVSVGSAKWAPMANINEFLVEWKYFNGSF
jgi:hypothetical protein